MFNMCKAILKVGKAELKLSDVRNCEMGIIYNMAGMKGTVKRYVYIPVQSKDNIKIFLGKI